MFNQITVLVTALVVTDNNGLKHKISLESSLILLLAVSGLNVCTVFICPENKHLRSFGQTVWMYCGVSRFTEQTIFDLQNLKINTKWNKYVRSVSSSSNPGCSPFLNYLSR